MQAVGIDIVAVSRFNHWQSYSLRQIQRIFSPDEYKAAQWANDGNYSPQMLAARFAAKEAFFKALCSLLIQCNHTNPFPPFLTVCKYVSVSHHTSGIPLIIIDNKLYEILPQNFNQKFYATVSLAHEKEYAVASVLLVKKHS